MNRTEENNFSLDYILAQAELAKKLNGVNGDEMNGGMEISI